MICFPNAKINLGLHVINKREDGFHNIETVFYPIPLCDMLEAVPLQVADQSLPYRFTAAGLPIITQEQDNLVLKAFKLLKRDFYIAPTDICLYKSIPMGAGLGGGSADAAFTLTLLNNLYQLNIPESQLKIYAEQLGSDCAFFIDNKPSYLYGKGHELESYAISLKGWYLVLIAPEVHSNTAIAYSQVKRREVLDEQLSLKNLLKLPVNQWKETIFNDFEKSVFAAYPQLAEFKKVFYDTGASYASMSGSGSSIFGLYSAEPKLPENLHRLVVYSGHLGI
jgi:4-diphosphocytidyl-2-C-methyl-D-erythritol kinase